MVICTYSVHITMANFFPIIQHENLSLNCSSGTFYVREEVHIQFRSLIYFPNSTMFSFLTCPFPRKMFRGYIVAMRQCNHGTI